MDIGKEDEMPVEFPIPVDPAKRQAPIQEPLPVTEPVQVPEPAHAMADAELDQALVDAVLSVGRQLTSMSERTEFKRCGRG